MERTLGVKTTERLNQRLGTIDHPREGVEFYDVFTSTGHLFGFCTPRAPRDFVYVQPEELRGVSVVEPMRVGEGLHPLTIAVFFTGAVCIEVNR